MLGSLVRIGLGIAILPAAITVDFLTWPLIASGDGRNSSTIAVTREIVSNIERALKEPSKKQENC